MSHTRASAERWRGVFREQQDSGLSVAAFCREAGVPPATFYAWRRRLRAATRSVASAPQRTSRKPPPREEMPFVEIKLSTDSFAAGPEPRPAGGIELYLPGRRWLGIRPGFDPRTLREVLAILDVSASNGTTGERGA